jgi:hypothetical protein
MLPSAPQPRAAFAFDGAIACFRENTRFDQPPTACDGFREELNPSYALAH